MTFLTPFWLALALALGLFILWLHLRRRTRRTEEVSSLYLWRKIAQNLPPQPPKEPPPLSPLLFLQLLVALLSALALAQPILGALGAKGAHTIYVLDASLSMQAGDVRLSRFAAAKAGLLRELQAQRGSRISVVVVDAAPHIVVARQQRSADISALLRDVNGADGLAAWQEAVSLVKGLTVEGERTRVVLLSDPNEVEVARTVLSQALTGQTIETRVLGKELANIGFFDIVPEASVNKKGLWRLEGHIANYGSEDKTVDLEVLFHAPDGTTTPLAKTNLKATHDQASFFRTEATPSGPGVVELRLPSDGLEADNHLYLKLAADFIKLRVLYLGPGNPALQKALLAMPNVEVFTADKLPADSDTYSLVVADGVVLERHPQTHTLWINSQPTPGSPKPALLADPYPSGWQSQHPLSASLDWSEVLLLKALDLPRLPGAELLLEAGGKPLIQARTNVYGREVVLGFSLADSNWMVKPGFPVFVANVLRWVEPRLGGTTYCRVGEVCAVDPKLFAGSWKLLDPKSQPIALPIAFSETTGQAKDPNLNRWLLPALEHSFRPREAGIYTLESDGVRHLIAVNALYGIEADLRKGSNQTEAATPVQNTRGIWPLWSWLLVLALLAVLIEGYLAGRGEGFLNSKNLLRRNPLAFRRRGMLVFQTLAALCLLLALLGLRIPLPTRESQTAVIADRPELYVGDSKVRLEQSLNQALAAGAGRSLVWLGDTPTLGADFGGRPNSTPPTAQTTPGSNLHEAPGSNLQATLSMAAGLLPPGPSNRVVLLADGTQTRGNFTDALGQLMARGIPVDVVPVGGIPAGEVVVEQVVLPQLVHVADTFVLQAIVYSEQATAAKLRVWRGEKLWAEQDINLLPGRNRVEAPLREDKAGNFGYRLEVTAPGDTFAQNNQASVSALVRPAATVGLFTSDEAEAEVMAAALGVQGLDVRMLSPESLPKSLEEWGQYDVAVLMNLPVVKLGSEQQKTLEIWVRDQGGGLLILGGENSFGPGGYYQTALDRMSPLSSRVPREAPKVAMLFVLDKSGSMNQPAGQARRIDIVKEATINALDLLHPESLAGVIAFDAKPQLSVPMQSVKDKEGFAQRLSSVQPSGGTSIYPALELALQTLQGVDAPGRHIVLMTDGLSTPGDFEGVVGKIVAQNITLSTVSVGEGARLDLMESIARWGGGVAHATTDWQALPAILAQEALLQSKTPVKQEAFVPVWRDRSASWLSGLPDALPPLRAYIQTTAKPEALVHLLGPGSDPILASWRYGVGQVVAFTSQGSGPWSSEWVRWPQFPRLWGQVIHAVLPNSANIGLNPQVERKGNHARLMVEALSPDGQPRRGLNLGATLSTPSGAKKNISLIEGMPGRYEANLVAEEVGDYRLEIGAVEASLKLQKRPFVVTREPPLPQPVQTAFSVPYPPRYTFEAQGGDVLVALAQATGGRVVLGDETPTSSKLHWTSWAAWPLLTLLALLFFLIGLVLRYLPELRVVRLRRAAMAAS